MSPTNASQNLKTTIWSSTYGGPTCSWSFSILDIVLHLPCKFPLCSLRLQRWVTGSILDPPSVSYLFPQTWDPVLAQIAKAWARNCQFAHNIQLKLPHKLHPNFTSLGENLWTGSLYLFSVSSAVTDWYNEIQYYDFKTQKCDKVCGHYTQVSICLIFSGSCHFKGEEKAGIWC